MLAHKTTPRRRGAIAVLTAVMIVILVGVLAFSIDYGFVLKARVDLQRAADAAALAGAQDLVPDNDGSQDVEQVRATARMYCGKNLSDESFSISDADIRIGRYDRNEIYSGLLLLNSGTYDTVQVTLRRNGTENPKVPLFFARLLGLREAAIEASAAAILPEAQLLPPGAPILPFATPKTLWDELQTGETWSAYGNGRLTDENGDRLPGNWGTLDVGATDNSTSTLNDQILNGLRQSDLDALYDSGRIQQTTHIDGLEPAWMNGDTGLSSGVKNSILEVHGEKRLVPLYDALGDTRNGENLELRIVGWGVVKIIDSHWGGANNTRVVLQKSHGYSGRLKSNGDLSSDLSIDGAYAAPVLVE